jgi:hypothetical protein
MAEFDPSNLSTCARDKLQAVLNHEWNAADRYLPKEYLEACAGWFASLTPSNALVAQVAAHAHTGGDMVRALKAAGDLPPAPKFPLSDTE